MRTVLYGVLLGVVVAAAPGRADDPPPLTATITNAEGRCTYAIDGRSPHLPDNTSLHVSLIVRGIQPPVEAAFFRVAVQTGTYSGSQDWEGQSFPPEFYTTIVRLHMDVQPPAVKQQLQQQFGYTPDQIVDIGTTDTQVGSAEEQAAHLKRTLTYLRDLCDKLEGFRSRLAEHSKPVAEDPSWAAFSTQLMTELDAAKEEYNQTFHTRVVWAQAGTFETLGSSLREFYRLREQHQAGDLMGVRRLGSMQQRLSRIRADIVSKLPEEQPPHHR
jgi:hypothetical protein